MIFKYQEDYWNAWDDQAKETLNILESTNWDIEYRSDDVTKTFSGFQGFGYHVSVEHDEKHPKPKLGGNRFMGTRDITTWIPN